MNHDGGLFSVFGRAPLHADELENNNSMHQASEIESEPEQCAKAEKYMPKKCLASPAWTKTVTEEQQYILEDSEEEMRMWIGLFV